MNNSLLHAFFVGRALAEAIAEQAQYAVTGALSEFGKFDAEQRERLRQFTEQVLEKAHRDEEVAIQNRAIVTGAYSESGIDLQATIDELRAEIAQLRTELQRYRSHTN